jgi:hypothetical protein
MPFTAIEREAIVLNAVLGMVDDMVNQAIFCLPGGKRHNTNLLPQTSDTLRQFAILLRDFLSPVTGRGKEPLPFGLKSHLETAAPLLTPLSSTWREFAKNR